MGVTKSAKHFCDISGCGNVLVIGKWGEDKMYVRKGLGGEGSETVFHRAER